MSVRPILLGDSLNLGEGLVTEPMAPISRDFCLAVPGEIFLRM
jgi:hypothetical protein